MTATHAHDPEHVPEVEVLTVDEAARVLRIGRNAAYSLARQWRTTNGRVGLPCIELGRSIRVPRSALDQMLASVLTSHVSDESG